MVLQQRGACSPAVEKSATTVTHLNASKSSLSAIGMVTGLWGAVRRLRPDIVHSHLLQSDFVSLMCPMRGTKRYTSIHSSFIGPLDPPRSRLVAKLVALMSHRFAGAIATSEQSLQYMAESGYRCSGTVVINGTPKVDPVSYSSEPVSFLSLARFHEVKGHAILLAAFEDHLRRHPESKLVCAGSGVAVDNPKFVASVGNRAIVLEDSGRAVFKGPQTDIRSLLEDSSALLISSVSTESFPIVGAEACMHGVPVITSDVGGAKAFATTDQWLVEPGSESQLSEAMDAFAELSPEERSKLSAQSRERALSEFDIHRVAERYTSLYRSFSHERPGR